MLPPKRLGEVAIALVGDKTISCGICHKLFVNTYEAAACTCCSNAWICSPCQANWKCECDSPRQNCRHWTCIGCCKIFSKTVPCSEIKRSSSHCVQCLSKCRSCQTTFCHAKFASASVSEKCYRCQIIYCKKCIKACSACGRRMCNSSALSYPVRCFESHQSSKCGMCKRRRCSYTAVDICPVKCHTRACKSCVAVLRKCDKCDIRMCPRKSCQKIHMHTAHPPPPKTVMPKKMKKRKLEEEDETQPKLSFEPTPVAVVDCVAKRTRRHA